MDDKNLWIGKIIAEELGIKKTIFNCEHHISHAASAFYPSPFEEAAIITIDGVGEWATSTYGIGRGNDIQIIEESRYPEFGRIAVFGFTFYAGFRIQFW